MDKDYLKYDVIDFAEDTSFIKGVQGEDQKAIAFWKEWAETHPEKAATIKEATILVKSIQIVEEEPSKERIQNLWGKIDAATQEKAAPTMQKEAVIRPLNRRRWIGYSAAASIALLIGFFALYNPSTTVSIGNGQHLTKILPDNSKIELNADSKIAYKEGNYAKNRTIHLDGEAFFEVEKGATFKVITPNGTVEVLGTSFNVNTRNGGLKVNCRTGKVRVTAKNSAETLTANEGTQLNATKSALEPKTTVNIDKEISWRKGEFNFTNTTFGEVIEELERQYDVTVEYDSSLKNRKGDYSFKANQLKEALDKITFPLNLKADINGEKVVLKK